MRIAGFISRRPILFSAVLIGVVTVGSLAAILGISVWTAFWEPERPFTLSRETTWIVEPLDEDGYPDYVRALNRMWAERTTPESNAAIDWWRIEGTRRYRSAQEERDLVVCLKQELGVVVEPAGEFVDLAAYRREREDAGKVWLASPDMESMTASRPWWPEEAPWMADWVSANDRALTRLIAASGKAGWYSPLVPSAGGSVAGATMADLEQLTAPPRALTIRAMLRTAEGDIEGSWEDLIAVRRFGRVVQQGPSLLHILMGIQIEECSHRAAVAWLEESQLTRQQSARFQKELNEILPQAAIDERLNIAERFFALSVATELAHWGPDGHPRRPLSYAQRWRRSILRADVNWDLALMLTNRSFDRFVDGARLEGRKARAAAWVTAASMCEEPKHSDLALQLPALFRPVPQGCDDVQARVERSARLLGIALALNAWRTEHGGYPARLNELVPDYLPAIPADPATGQTPEYAPEGGGYRLGTSAEPGSLQVGSVSESPLP